MGKVKKCKGCGKKKKCAGNYCYSCRHEREKKSDPVKYAFDTLRRNAKRRNKDFYLTLDQFREFCFKTSYMSKKGIRAESYHIDRIDSSKGYSIDNIQIITNRENVRKKWIEYKGRNRDGSPILKTQLEPLPVQYPDCPF